MNDTVKNELDTGVVEVLRGLGVDDLPWVFATDGVVRLFLDELIGAEESMGWGEYIEIDWGNKAAWHYTEDGDTWVWGVKDIGGGGSWRNWLKASCDEFRRKKLNQENLPQISPEVREELKRLGVDDLPWEHGRLGSAELRVWNHRITFRPEDIDTKTGVWRCMIDGESPLPAFSPSEWLDLARARYTKHAPDPKPTYSPKELLDDLKPSNVSWTVENLQGEPLPQSMACAVSVTCAEALTRGVGFKTALERIRATVEPAMNHSQVRSETMEPVTECEEARRADESTRETIGEALELLREESHMLKHKVELTLTGFYGVINKLEELM